MTGEMKGQKCKMKCIRNVCKEERKKEPASKCNTTKTKRKKQGSDPLTTTTLTNSISETDIGTATFDS